MDDAPEQIPVLPLEIDMGLASSTCEPGARSDGPYRISSTPTSAVTVKRLYDVLLSALGLVALSPLLLMIAALIKLADGGTILYRQLRVGLHGRPFLICKFRTMVPQAEASGPLVTSDRDERVTTVGRFLRKTKLDEIPQLWNVLRGDMNLVGPRPERPEFVDSLNREIPNYEFRHVIRPGITGWAQIRYKYGNSIADAKEKLQYDLFYIKNMSLGLDCLILFETIKTVLLGRGSK